ncbi:hypothetical protein SAMN05660461_2814 [Chitinophaga ginsengisegetis]|jgi:hypothetical protein|uniref:Uncharacterized protein n=1 Tax=Chitinophaga ginsengisegetis TaxID=393003 RepID=A0A1T5NV01_9BACT|nr:hypothetical protein [Chitinophaga ginsengisegetis]SKD04320.1 hypothetical protein SAMN05660461_2814 [Chitinophaga ginsengisegetis]
MKKAKLALTAVSIFATIGGSLAFKANRSINVFYSFGTTIRFGEEIQGCVISTGVLLTPVPAGGFVTTLYSSSFNDQSTTCTSRVTASS